MVFVPGCANVAANYPDDTGPAKWTTNFEGHRCEYAGVVFKVREKSDTLLVREMRDTLQKKMESKAGKAQADAAFDQAAKGHELGRAMREDREHVFYRGSLTLTKDVEVGLRPGCLLLTIRTESGTVTVPDSGIIIPKHRDRNDYLDTGREAVSIDRRYNNLLPGDENRIQVRSRVFGEILEVAIDPEKLDVR